MAAITFNSFLDRVETMSSGAMAWKIPAKIAQTVAEWGSFTPWHESCQALGGKIKEVAAPLALPAFLEKVLKFKKEIERICRGEVGSEEAITMGISGGADCLEKGVSLLTWLDKAQFLVFAASYLTVFKAVGAIAGLVSKSAKIADIALRELHIVQDNRDPVTNAEFAKAILGFTLAALTVISLFYSLEIQILLLLLGTSAMAFELLA